MIYRKIKDTDKLKDFQLIDYEDEDHDEVLDAIDKCLDKFNLQLVMIYRDEKSCWIGIEKT